MKIITPIPSNDKTVGIGRTKLSRKVLYHFIIVAMINEFNLPFSIFVAL